MQLKLIISFTVQFVSQQQLKSQESFIKSQEQGSKFTNGVFSHLLVCFNCPISLNLNHINKFSQSIEKSYLLEVLINFGLYSRSKM